MRAASRRSPRGKALIVPAAALFLAGTGLAGAAVPSARASTAPQVLLVGSYNGIPGTYSTLRAALAAAQSGDWILVGPGDYKTPAYGGGTAKASGGQPAPAGALITTPGVHVRGMDRNSVVIDGTKPGSPECSPAKSDQQFSNTGANGVEVYKASGTYVENLTVCNYLTDSSGDNGNQIWWNGGQGSGKIGMGSYWGNYLTATSTYSNGVNAPYGDYGIYADNANGPGSFEHTYASNQGDSGYYIGACQNCNAVISDAHAEDNALGFSGTNSGGNLVIENSVWDHNKSGLTSNSQNNDDAPSPQSGACPDGGTGPLGNGSCEIWRGNQVVDNNNPNVPGNSTNGLAGASPVGSGIVLAGTRQVTLSSNTVTGNGSWGVLVADLPDQEYPPTSVNGENCQGGTYLIPPGTPGQAPMCYFQALGNQVLANSFSGNGSFGNPSNGDAALFSGPSTDMAAPHHVYNADCFSGNTDPGGFTSDPPNAQSDPALDCNKPSPGNPDPALVIQAECAAQLLASCPSAPAPGLNYPRPSAQFTLSMPAAQPTMPNPCADVPADPWCP